MKLEVTGISCLYMIRGGEDGPGAASKVSSTMELKILQGLDYLASITLCEQLASDMRSCLQFPTMSHAMSAFSHFLAFERFP